MRLAYYTMIGRVQLAFAIDPYQHLVGIDLAINDPNLPSWFRLLIGIPFVQVKLAIRRKNASKIHS